VWVWVCNKRVQANSAAARPAGSLVVDIIIGTVGQTEEAAEAAAAGRKE